MWLFTSGFLTGVAIVLITLVAWARFYPPEKGKHEQVDRGI